jgi:hypothetical protein
LKPRIGVVYFPPQTLNSGESWKAPRTKIMIGGGDWKPVARAYRDWYGSTFRMASRPAWGDRIDSWMGAWFAKKGGVLPPGGCGGLTQAWTASPNYHGSSSTADLHEYSFHTQGSSRDPQVHTDGDNVLRGIGRSARAETRNARIHSSATVCFLCRRLHRTPVQRNAKSGKADRGV